MAKFVFWAYAKIRLSTTCLKVKLCMFKWAVAGFCRSPNSSNSNYPLLSQCNTWRAMSTLFILPNTVHVQKGFVIYSK